MRSLWTRIGLGALAVFAVGMMAFTMVGEVRQGVRNAVQSVITSSLSTMGGGRFTGGTESLASWPNQSGVSLPFVLDGKRLGSIRHLSVHRARRGELPDMTLLVATEPGASLSLPAECQIHPADVTRADLEHGFSCGGEMNGDLVPVGQVWFEPAHLNRPFLLPRSAVEDIGHGGPFRATADLGAHVNVSAQGDKGEGVRVDAGEGKATIQVNDSLGRALVRLLADSTGALLRVRGKDGRDVVRMDAGKGGFSLSVDTAAN
ncbi:MAG TPA: hypothetical protein VMG41_15005 [Gemmatimonadales bacterium]|nr:hypothetical protein [Gemmatimonadales bacterium]